LFWCGAIHPGARVGAHQLRYLVAFHLLYFSASVLARPKSEH
jgi:hypothetical protein